MRSDIGPLSGFIRIVYRIQWTNPHALGRAKRATRGKPARDATPCRRAGPCSADPPFTRNQGAPGLRLSCVRLLHAGGAQDIRQAVVALMAGILVNRPLD